MAGMDTRKKGRPSREKGRGGVRRKVGAHGCKLKASGKIQDEIVSNAKEIAATRSNGMENFNVLVLGKAGVEKVPL